MNTSKHQHGPDCGHIAIKHQGHTDYLETGHLEHQEGEHLEQHVIEVDSEHPDGCTVKQQLGGHPKGHVHGANCGHPAVPHGDHIDYLVDGRLHHPHSGHCDDHGELEVLKAAA